MLCLQMIGATAVRYVCLDAWPEQMSAVPGIRPSTLSSADSDDLQVIMFWKCDTTCTGQASSVETGSPTVASAL